MYNLYYKLFFRVLWYVTQGYKVKRIYEVDVGS